MLWVYKYGFYRGWDNKKSRHVKGAWFEVPSFILQKNCISLEKTPNFRHKDLTAAKAQEEPWNQIASFCQQHKGGARPCPQHRLWLGKNDENGKYFLCYDKKGSSEVLRPVCFDSIPPHRPTKRGRKAWTHELSYNQMPLTGSLTCECRTNCKCGDDYNSHLGCTASVCEKPRQS